MSAVRGRLADMAWRLHSAFSIHTDNTDERTGLIHPNNRRRLFHVTSCEKLWIVMLGLLLIAGVSCATYLLLMEGRDPTTDGFVLVPPRQSISRSRCANLAKVLLPVQAILLLPTNTSDCSKETDCLENLKNVQIDSYNFVIVGNDKIYEGKGWNCTSEYTDNGIQLISVAFLGKYVDQPPTETQINRLESFLEYAKMLNILSNCHRIVVRDSKTRFMTDVAFKLEERRQKNIC